MKFGTCSRNNLKKHLSLQCPWVVSFSSSCFFIGNTSKLGQWIYEGSLYHRVVRDSSSVSPRDASASSPPSPRDHGWKGRRLGNVGPFCRLLYRPVNRMGIYTTFHTVCKKSSGKIQVPPLQDLKVKRSLRNESVGDFEDNPSSIIDSETPRNVIRIH